MSLISNKKLLRKSLKENRGKLTTEDFISQQRLVSNLLYEFLIQKFHQTPKVVLGYVPIEREFNLFDCWFKLAEQGHTILLPKVRGKEAPLDFVVYDTILTDQKQPFASLKGRDIFNIPIPLGKEYQGPIDVCIMPCLGFMLKKGRLFRLGYGGGFYDRSALALVDVFRVGVSSANAQVLFEQEEFDLPLDVMVTEVGVV
jgi:5-formyltetrahydrofolate cyclo-ligase